MSCKDHHVLYGKHAEILKHVRPYVTSHPETIYFTCLSLRDEKKIILAYVSDIQNGNIPFILGAELKHHANDAAQHLVVKILD